MTTPGTRIHRFATRWLPPNVVARLVTPTVADMQWDVDVARRDGGRKAHCAALARGYSSLLRLVPMVMLHTSRHLTQAFLLEDDQALRRVATYSTGAVLVCTLLMILPLYDGLRRASAAIAPSLILLLIPQALGMALPVGFLIGSLIGLRARGPKKVRTLRRLLVGAGAVAVLTLATIDSVVPAANQRYRELLASDLVGHGILRTNIHLERGWGERSMRELYQAQSRLPPAESKDRQTARYLVHSRLALVLSPVCLAILAFGAMSIGRERWSGVAAAIILVVGVIQAVWSGVLASGWPPLVRVYTPDVVFGIWGAVLLWCSVRWPEGDQQDARQG